MPTVVQSCRLEKEAASLLAKQAKRKHLDVSSLSSIYLSEKTREEEFPGIGFRDSVGGREAYLQGTRLAVWELMDVYMECKSIAKTAEHYRFPEYLVKCAVAYAKTFPEEMVAERAAEVSE
jgi:hypothetical protein